MTATLDWARPYDIKNSSPEMTVGDIFVTTFLARRSDERRQDDAITEAAASLRRLRDNWDGYGARAPFEAAIVNAITAASQLRDIGKLPAPELTANTNGTESIEWETELGGAHLEVGITRWVMYIRPRVGGTKYFKGTHADFPAAADRIARELKGSLFATPFRSPKVTAYWRR